MEPANRCEYESTHHLSSALQSRTARPWGTCHPAPYSETSPEDVATLEEVYEPFLIQNGFLMRTPRGRVATNKAFRHLGYALPAERVEAGYGSAQPAPQANLFEG